MTDLIPIEEVIEENPRVKELENQGFIITPENIDTYLDEIKSHTVISPNEDYWKSKRVLITGISGLFEAKKPIIK